MPRILALDWDQHEARYVLATAHGEKVQIRAAATVSLIDVVVAGGDPHPDLGNLLRSALAREKVGRVVTLVGADRGSIELLPLTLPPAEDAELPQLVANQAMRESPNIGEDWAIDFLPMDDDPAEPREVTAVALAPERLEQIQAACAEAGLKPDRLLLRPFGSASLFSRTASDAEPVCLLVNRVADEVDLTILVDGKTTFSRTLRLPRFAEPEKAIERIVAEIQRTLAVGLQSQFANRSVEQIYVFGRAGEHQDLIDQIRRELSMRAETFDPFEAVDMRGTLAADSGSFASLLGMVLDEAHGGAHAVDFLHPRQKPKPIDRRKIIAMAAVAVAAIVLAAGYFVRSELGSIDVKNRNLQGKLSRLTKKVKAAADDVKVFAAVNEWQAGDVIWLEELRELSIRLPADQDAVILRMSMTPARSSGGGGAITFEGLASDPLTVTRMGYMLRDGFHRVRSPSVRQRAGESDYPWHFNASVFVTKRNKRQYTSHLEQQAVDSRR